MKSLGQHVFDGALLLVFGGVVFVTLKVLAIIVFEFVK